MMDKVTSQEVAKRAGVSQSAVSRVFTPGASASDKTILKVREAAEEGQALPGREAPLQEQSERVRSMERRHSEEQ